MRTEASDVLVIGTGIAGLVLAKTLAGHGQVTVITKKKDTETSTNLAQGGIAAVLAPTDSFESHIEDTLVAGDGLCDRDAVEMMVREGPALVRRLVDWGARFNLTPNGQTFDLGMEGGHSHRRILHAADMTGREIERALLASLEHEPNVQLLQHQTAVRLLVDRSAGGICCRGALVLDTAGNQLIRYLAKTTVLATGGMGRVYLHTTNPTIATGDGIAMAYRVGAKVANLEFIQFHPTTFCAGPGQESFLISEAVRGEGAVLRTLDGQTFMERYHPRGCLAPRDVVARAIDREMKRSGDPYVLLDLSMLDADFIRQRFPFITESCLRNGVDPTREPVPVVPAAHYCCGGVLVDRDGQTSVDRLYATGEVSCTGVHGANRLASNSLLEALVWSCRAARHIAERLPSLEINPLAGADLPERTGTAVEGVRIAHCIQEVRSIMWDYVGIVRSEERLRLAHRRIAIIQQEIEGYVRQNDLSPELIEVWNACDVADLVIHSAILRKESRGLHYIIEYPDKDDINWRQNTILRRKYPL